MGKKMSLRKLIDDENYMVVLDTNVFMRLYDYSPEFSCFALECINKVLSNIVIPYTVKIEFMNNCRAGFARMKHRIENYDKKAIEQIDTFETKILDRCEEISKRHFPDVDELKGNILSSIQSIRGHFSEYLDEHSFLELLNSDWLETDSISALVQQIITDEHVMDIITPEQMYEFCNEGAKRYKKKTPPGFKDAKDKDGIRKYSDLILWKEVLHYALKHKRDIIFVTDDVKSDWWEQDEAALTFHTELITEFVATTKKKIYACTSLDFFNGISNDFMIEKSDAVELALGKTVMEYAKAISEKVFESISDEIRYLGETYLDVDTYSEIEFEDGVSEYTFLSAELVEREENTITYLLKYEVELEGESYEYWGRDDDTKEAILSPANLHTFKGIIEVEVIREIETFADFANDKTFHSAQIVSGDLKQINFKSCYSDDGYEDAENFCPSCGKPLTFENDPLTGFCVDCEREK